MTRINCIPVYDLHDKHLIAEYRELPRIFSLVEKAIRDNRITSIPIPDEYVLGAGHCYFFYDKLSYLASRHAELVYEMQCRGFKPTLTENLSDVYWYLPTVLWNDWNPSQKAISTNNERINERLKVMVKNKALLPC